MPKLTVLLTNGNEKPVDNAPVDVQWHSGDHSSDRTDSSGTVTFKILGTIESISVRGNTLVNSRVYYDRDTTLPLVCGSC